MATAVLGMTLGILFAGMLFGYYLKVGREWVRRRRNALLIMVDVGKRLVRPVYAKPRGQAFILKGADGRKWYVPVEKEMPYFGVSPTFFVEAPLGHPISWRRIKDVSKSSEKPDKDTLELAHLPVVDAESDPDLERPATVTKLAARGETERLAILRYPAWRLELIRKGENMKNAMEGGGFDMRTLAWLVIGGIGMTLLTLIILAFMIKGGVSAAGGGAPVESAGMAAAMLLPFWRTRQ